MHKVQEEFLDWHGHGTSIIEISHRSEKFLEVLHQAESDLRELLSVPSSYRVLFMSCGGTAHFQAVALNLGEHEKVANYAISGHWSNQAYQEAAQYTQVHCVHPKSEDPYSVYEYSDWALSERASYMYYCSNETIHGIQFKDVPDISNCPLVCDMSSDFLSRPIPIHDYGLIFASTQKNIGPSGLTIVIIREDLLDRAQSITPTLLNYSRIAQTGSLLNTPNTFAIYFSGLVFQWIMQQGGLKNIHQHNQKKSHLLYDAIDQSHFYINHVPKHLRSEMNVVFNIYKPELETLFWQEAEQHGLLYLRGHRVLGGLRASLYNAMPLEGVETLVSFMSDFSKRYG